MLGSFGVDVLDPRITPRRLRLLAERLPPAARRPGEDWSTEAELLALLVDQLAGLTWITLRAAGAKGAPKPRPLQRPRPRAAERAAAAQGPQERKPAQGKTGSWAAALGQLAVIPGVVVTDG